MNTRVTTAHVLARRVVAQLDEDAYELLRQKTTPRKIGPYLSQLIRSAAADAELPEDEDVLLARIEVLLARVKALREERGPSLPEPTAAE